MENPGMGRSDRSMGDNFGADFWGQNSADKFRFYIFLLNHAAKLVGVMYRNSGIIREHE